MSDTPATRAQPAPACGRGPALWELVLRDVADRHLPECLLADRRSRYARITMPAERLRFSEEATRGALLVSPQEEDE